MNITNLRIIYPLRTLILSGILSVLVISGLSQTIPHDSLYLGQTPPGITPQIFKLEVSNGSFAAERMSISNNGREVFYSEIKSYYPINSAKIRSYKYTEGQWTGPVILFDDFCSPALSVTGDTMYFENGNAEAFFSIKKESEWSMPKSVFSKLESAHYLQVTNYGNYYVSSRPENTIGVADWCKINITNSDTTVIGLGMPLNTAWDNLDFFVSRDESFMIVTTPWGLSISYPKKDSSWTNPRNLGSKINFGLGMWGPYVTSDNRYLFYTTGTKPDYSDVNVYWVRVDGLIDSLKFTNIPPYNKNKLKSQKALVGDSFSFSIPDDTFFDEDGGTIFSYTTTQIDGSPLPSWLIFNELTKTFSGVPTGTGELRIIVTATDTGNDSGIGAFRIVITDKP
ncbi:MAG: putative Ig domain-containing protein [Bacteroidales bacterium]|nr:putative Ig domain-containing protein [Bacteroidales bacterium]